MKINEPEKLGRRWSNFQNSAGERFALHQRRRVRELLLLDQFAGDTRRHARLARRNDDAHARVTAAAHRPATSVHHETHQEASTKRIQRITEICLPLTCFLVPARVQIPNDILIGSAVFAQLKAEYPCTCHRFSSQNCPFAWGI